jgi:hypothetical protein
MKKWRMDIAPEFLVQLRICAKSRGLPSSMLFLQEHLKKQNVHLTPRQLKQTVETACAEELSKRCPRAGPRFLEKRSLSLFQRLFVSPGMSTWYTTSRPPIPTFTAELSELVSPRWGCAGPARARRGGRRRGAEVSVQETQTAG